MAYNFKSIADVEVVVEPDKSANVLIEEDGVIKKTPKTAVGGSWDAIFEIIEGNSGYFNSVDLISGSYSELKQIIDNGERIPNILIRYANADGDVTINANISPLSVIHCNGDNEIYIEIAIYVDRNNRHFRLYNDNTTSNH